MQLAFREALDRGAGVTEQHAAGAVAVKQLTHQAGAGLGIAIIDGGQQGIAFGTEETVDGFVGFRGQAAFIQQLLYGLGHRAIVFAFGAEGGQVVETVRIQQAQARKVAVLAQLFRGGSEQQHAGDYASQLFYQTVLGADVVFVPHQVVRFVDHQQVPVGIKQRGLGLGIVHQPFQGNQRQLAVFERVAGVAFDKALFVEQRHFQVEAATHLDQPLVLQVFRDYDQYTVGAATEQLAVNHQACFDGFTQAHFVGQQNPWGDTVSDFTGNVQLVRDRLRTHATQAPQRRLQLTAGVFEGVVAQREPGQRVDLPGKQAVTGQTELDKVRQLGFWQGNGFVSLVEAVVDHQTVDVLDFAHGHLPAFEVDDGVTRREPYTRERCVAQRILAGFASGRIEHGQQATVLCQNGAQT